MGKLVALAEASIARQSLRRQGKTVVFTNGIFDLLHVGHVRYLKGARELGHALFVGLNSDSSTRELKGLRRPLVPQEERAEVLCALASVDYVLFFDDLTAERPVKVLQPDIYVKGGDYAAGRGDKSPAGTAPDGEGKALPEARIVESYGGRVVILPFTSGHSTSRIVQRLLDGRDCQAGE